MNTFIGVGRLTRDVELRYTQAGIPVASFTIAIDRPTGGDKKETDYIDCVVWRKGGEAAANYLGKGRKVAVEGALHVRSYETSDGQKRKAWEINVNHWEFADSKPTATEQSQGVAKTSAPAYDSLNLDDDPDLPF